MIIALIAQTQVQVFIFRRQMFVGEYINEINKKKRKKKVFNNICCTIF